MERPAYVDFSRGRDFRTIPAVDPRRAAAADAAALEEALLGHWRRSPSASARWPLSFTQGALALFFIILAVSLFWRAPETASLIAALLASVFFAALVGIRVLGAAATLASTMTKSETDQGPVDAALPRYTILCPLFREARCLPRLAEALRALDYPKEKLQIVLALEADDAATIAAAARWAPDFEVSLTQPSLPRTKPKALNVALAKARGDLIVVYDAEDRPHPGQLRAAVAAFAGGDARLGAVQAPLLIQNGRESWISGQFAAEYATHFLGIVPALVRLGMPPPLGGTSNHFRAAALRTLGGWDPYNVTEDAEIGYRMARAGFKIGAIAPPTLELAPTRAGAWVRQRSRWIKGYLITWLVIMRRPAAAARELGPLGFLAMNVSLLGGVLPALLHAPTLAMSLAPLFGAPAMPSYAFALLIAGHAASLLGAIAAAAVLRQPRIALAALTTPFYWPLGFLAALRTCVELVVSPHYWAKTEH